MPSSDAIPDENDGEAATKWLSADELEVVDVLFDLPNIIADSRRRSGMLSCGLASWGTRKRRSLPPPSDEGRNPNLVASSSASRVTDELKMTSFVQRIASPETPLSFPSSGAEDNDGPVPTPATPSTPATRGGAPELANDGKNCKKAIERITATSVLTVTESVNVGQRIGGPSHGPLEPMGLTVAAQQLSGDCGDQYCRPPTSSPKLCLDLNVTPPGAAEFWAGCEVAVQLAEKSVISTQARKRRLEKHRDKICSLAYKKLR